MSGPAYNALGNSIQEILEKGNQVLLQEATDLANKEFQSSPSLQGPLRVQEFLGKNSVMVPWIVHAIALLLDRFL